MGHICSKCNTDKPGGTLGKPIKYQHSYDYDLIVVGGGSGGIAAAKEAADAEQKVLLCDFVTPSPIGSTWGLGGTCTNVGCVPKKLLHVAALSGDHIRMAPAYGYNSIKSLIKKASGMIGEEVEHNWNQLIEDVQDHIQSLNWKYKLQLHTSKIDYFNDFVTFEGPHKISGMQENGKVEAITGNHFILATGGRPKYLNIPGGRKEDALCITSDDLFALPYHPGKVVIIGGSYVALECAGFLISLNCEVTVLVRSILLRGYDQDMANRIKLHLQSLGVLFYIGFEPIRISKLEDGNPPKFVVTAKNVSEADFSPTTVSEIKNTYNTVLLAIGREPSTHSLKLDKIGVNTSTEGKILVNAADQSSLKHVYAVGDCADGRPEFASLAIKSGSLLAQRLYRGSKTLTEYNDVPTTIFTPLEYGCVGLAEEDAIAKYTESNTSVYHTLFQPLEYTLPRILPNTCYLKIICVNNQKQKVVGLHYFGPNAGEVVQGFAIALKLNAKKSDFDRLVGIHPTCAERFTTLYLKKGITKEDLEANC